MKGVPSPYCRSSQPTRKELTDSLTCLFGASCQLLVYNVTSHDAPRQYQHYRNSTQAKIPSKDGIAAIFMQQLTRGLVTKTSTAVAGVVQDENEGYDNMGELDGHCPFTVRFQRSRSSVRIRYISARMSFGVLGHIPPHVGAGLRRIPNRTRSPVNAPCARCEARQLGHLYQQTSDC